MFDKNRFFQTFTSFSKVRGKKRTVKLLMDQSIRLGVRSLQGPTNTSNSTVGIRLGVRSLQGPTNSTS